MVGFNRSTLPSQLLWYALSAALLLTLPLLWFHVPWWSLAHRDVLGLIGLLGAFAASAALVMMFVRERGPRAALAAVTITLAVFGLLMLAFMVSGRDVSRVLLMTWVAVSVLTIAASAWLPLRRSSFIALTVIVLSLGFAAAFKLEKPRQTAQMAQTLIKTAFYNVREVVHAGLIPMPATRGGGLHLIGSRILLGTGDGHLYLLTPKPNSDEIEKQELPSVVPANREEFARSFGGSAHAPERSSGYSEAGPPKVQTWRMRIADVITQSSGDKLTILASHHFWKEDQACMVVRVSALDVDANDLAGSMRAATWRTLYESTPCVPLKGEMRKRGKNPFKGEEVGGRMAVLDEHHVMLTLGDQGFSGLESLQAFSQDPQAAYGKTIRIDTDTGASEIYSLGHRNPEGLFIVDPEHIWLTEHAAQGGDELNRVIQGTNYGWPRVTYGTDYGLFAWPLSQTQGRHTGYQPPVYSWLPSIGTSNLIMVKGDKFPVWSGNLLVSSLATRSLYRLVLEDNHVTLSETIPIQKRIRDLIELPDGRIMLWTDDSSIVTLEPSSGSSGATLFATSCAGCHQITDGLSHTLGPDLKGVLDRGVAAAKGYDEYSSALKAQQGKWDRSRLDTFVTSPNQAVPGTSMGFAGLSDKKQRDLLLDFLESTTRSQD
jgi:cytochrome c2